MHKITLLITMACMVSLHCYCQKKYGYTNLHFRCGDNDSQRDLVYYSPIIELNTLNFPEYTDGMDPAIPIFSVRYYNYAISKWFEIYLKNKYKILINTRDRYARKSGNVVFNDTPGCNDDKTSPGCFFTDKQELAVKRMKDISLRRSASYEMVTCEVIDL